LNLWYLGERIENNNKKNVNINYKFPF
jgi:hypothetical protein